MVPFDGSGGPQQGQPGMPMPPMPPGHSQSTPSPVMQPGHHQPMNAPPYGHRNSLGMQGQPPFMPSPARQGSFTGGMQGGNQYSGHPPLHSPHQSQSVPPMGHPMPHPQQMQHRTSMTRPMPGMGMQPMPNHHDSMRNSSQGSHNRQSQHYNMGNANNSSAPSLSGGWQSDNDTPHRREMIQQMYVWLSP